MKGKMSSLFIAIMLILVGFSGFIVQLDTSKASSDSNIGIWLKPSNTNEAFYNHTNNYNDYSYETTAVGDWGYGIDNQMNLNVHAQSVTSTPLYNTVSLYIGAYGAYRVNTTGSYSNPNNDNGLYVGTTNVRFSAQITNQEGSSYSPHLDLQTSFDHGWNLTNSYDTDQTQTSMFLENTTKYAVTTMTDSYLGIPVCSSWDYFYNEFGPQNADPEKTKTGTSGIGSSVYETWWHPVPDDEDGDGYDTSNQWMKRNYAASSRLVVRFNTSDLPDQANLQVNAKNLIGERLEGGEMPNEPKDGAISTVNIPIKKGEIDTFSASTDKSTYETDDYTPSDSNRKYVTPEITVNSQTKDGAYLKGEITWPDDKKTYLNKYINSSTIDTSVSKQVFLDEIPEYDPDSSNTCYPEIKVVVWLSNECGGRDSDSWTTDSWSKTVTVKDNGKKEDDDDGGGGGYVPPGGVTPTSDDPISP